MIRHETDIVTVENGVRPAGPPDRCFYCRQLVGTPHDLRCPCRDRTVVVRYIVEAVVIVPQYQTVEDILFHRNESSWCASNLIDDLNANDNARCLCHYTRTEFVREAAEEDDQRLIKETAMAQRSDLVFTVDLCPRCGQQHDDLDFDRMESSVSVLSEPRPVHPVPGVTEYVIDMVPCPLWAMCPTKAEPILARIVGEGEVEVR